MSTARRVAKNTLVRSVAEALNVVLSMFFLMYVTRRLGTEDFGKYVFAFYLGALFIVIGEMGLHTLLAREIAKDRDRAGKVIGNALVLKIFLVMVYFAFLKLVVFLMGYPPEVSKIVYLMAGFVLATSYIDLFNAIFRGLEKMEYEAGAMFLNRVMVVTSGILAVYLGAGLNGFVLTIFLANLVATIPAMLVSFKLLRPRLNMDLGLAKSLLKDTLPIGLMMVFTSIILKSGTVMLSFFQNDIAVGLYGAPHRLFESLLIFPGFFSAALLPVFTKLHTSNREGLARGYAGSLRLLTMVGLPIAAGITVLADKFIFLLFGQAYGGSEMVLQILIWAWLFAALNVMLTHFMIASGKQRLNMAIYGACTVGHLVFAIWLIPTFSYTGTSLALLLSQVLLFGSMFFSVSREFFRAPALSFFLKPFASSLLMGGIIFFLKTLNLFLVVLISAGLYFCFLLLFRGLIRDDLTLAKEIIGVKL